MRADEIEKSIIVEQYATDEITGSVLFKATLTVEAFVRLQNDEINITPELKTRIRQDLSEVLMRKIYSDQREALYKAIYDLRKANPLDFNEQKNRTRRVAYCCIKTMKIHDVEQQSREGENNPCYRHGHACRSGRSPEYKSYQSMLARCYNPKNRSFRYYGARGIKVCYGWRESFQNFLRDMGPKPSPEFSIDRIDPNGSYRKSNCRWSDPISQRRSRRDCKVYQFNGARGSLSFLAQINHIPYLTVWDRINKCGWPLSRALRVPRRFYPRLRPL